MTDDAKSTPGPWEAIKTPYGNWMVRCCAAEHPEYSRPHQPALIWWHEEHAAANAKLLAAAWLLPELAEALRPTADGTAADGGPCWCTTIFLDGADAGEHAPYCAAARTTLARYEDATR